MKRILLLAAIITAGFAAAAEESRKDGVSRSGKIGWHVVETKDGADVLLSEADQGESAAQKICEAPSVANTEIFVAPDDSWIIVRSGGGSLGISFRAFKRENGMIYNEDPAEDITTAVLASACGGDKAKAEAMDHVYADFAGWSGDSKSVLVSVSARGGERKIGPHFAIYHLGSHEVGYDLAKFSAGALGPPKR